MTRDMTVKAPEIDVDIDLLVADMIDKGPSNVSRPGGLPESDFERLRAILVQVIKLYHPHERYAPWQPGPRLLNQVTLIDLFKNRDYRTAESYLDIESGFLPS